MITRHAITWTFSQPVEYGQFVNGDYWVIGPVTIVSVSPAPAGDKHGSMLNPSIGDGQAYDSVGGAYSAAAGVTFPVMLTGDNSLVSTRSWTDTADIHQDLTGHNIAATTCNIRDASVLTVLTDVPPAKLIVKGRVRPEHHLIQAHYGPGALKRSGIAADGRIVEHAAEIYQCVLL